ncbi:unnamed protein product [Clonostachys byssicola]|uniref:Alpha/beta hydrolase fold-3 domain-containing protein n=1 Tax=Clonostachys byssicola TaxID=160290 RepID=A0A9N9UP33_9HYPO|nr:unnamed protein product [Clonostachys byssicola]
MAPVFSKQPLKTVAKVGFQLATPFYFLYLALRMSISSLRQDSRWSMKEAIVNAFFRANFHLLTATRDQLEERTTPGKLGDQYVRIEPADTKYLKGALTPGAIQPKSLPGVWFPGPPSGESTDEKVVIYFPGGAFVVGFEASFLGPIVADGLTKELGATRLLFAQYRLARDEQSRFPAAIQDAVTFYSYVLSQGVKASNIIISGDSAGGNVCLGLLRYLESEQSELPKPSAALAWSPWVSVPTDAGAQFAKLPNAEKDLIYPEFLQWGADSYRPVSQPDEEAEGYLDPLKYPFKLTVPLFIQAGGLEGFRDQIHEFAEKMTQENGEDLVRYHESPLVAHDLVLLHGHIGKTELNQTAVREANEFIQSTK